MAVACGEKECDSELGCDRRSLVNGDLAVFSEIKFEAAALEIGFQQSEIVFGIFRNQDASGCLS
jgi:hypothetical protein